MKQNVASVGLRMDSDEPLPGRAKVGGYVYVIKFSDSRIKVGATKDPKKRMAQHASNAAVFGVKIADWWLSPLHDKHETSERQLLNEVRDLGGTLLGREFFSGVSFRSARAKAERLSFVPVDPDAADREAEQAENGLRELGRACFAAVGGFDVFSAAADWCESERKRRKAG